MVLYFNRVRENGCNTTYPYKLEITCPDDLKNVVCYDHVCAEYMEFYRKNDNFISYFPDVVYTDADEYGQCKERVCRYFTAFDQNAKDVARFFFGVEQPSVEFYPGKLLLSDFMKRAFTQRNEESKHIWKSETNNVADVIPEGMRNTTMFRFAERVLKESGDTEEVFRDFMDESKKCSPPLDEKELNSIWKSAKKRYHESREQDWTANDSNNCVWDLLDLIDKSAMKELHSKSPQKRVFNIRTAKLFLQAFISI